MLLTSQRHHRSMSSQTQLQFRVTTQFPPDRVAGLRLPVLRLAVVSRFPEASVRGAVPLVRSLFDTRDALYGDDRARHTCGMIPKQEGPSTRRASVNDDGEMCASSRSRYRAAEQGA